MAASTKKTKDTPGKIPKLRFRRVPVLGENPGRRTEAISPQHRTAQAPGLIQWSIGRITTCQVACRSKGAAAAAAASATDPSAASCGDRTIVSLPKTTTCFRSPDQSTSCLRSAGDSDHSTCKQVQGDTVTPHTQAIPSAILRDNRLYFPPTPGQSFHSWERDQTMPRPFSDPMAGVFERGFCCPVPTILQPRHRCKSAAKHRCSIAVLIRLTLKTKLDWRGMKHAGLWLWLRVFQKQRWECYSTRLGYGFG